MPGRPAKEVMPSGIACHAVALCEGREASLDFLAAQKQIRAFNSTSNTQRATLRQKECRRKARWGARSRTGAGNDTRTWCSNDSGAFDRQVMFASVRTALIAALSRRGH